MAETKESTMNEKTDFLDWLQHHPILAVLFFISVGLFWLVTQIGEQNGWWRKK